MASKKDTQAITFRAPTDVIRQLDELCNLMGIKRSEFIVTAITSEYDKLHGNPQMKQMMEQLRQIADIAKQMTGVSNGSGATIVAGNGGEVEA